MRYAVLSVFLQFLRCCRCAVVAGVFFLLSGCVAYFDSSPRPELTEKVVRRLEREEKLPLARLSKSTPQTLDAAIAENEAAYTKLDLSLPSSSMPTRPVKPPETHQQLSIAEARAMALSNNLDLSACFKSPENQFSSLASIKFIIEI